MTDGPTPFDAQHKIWAGKFRRYNGETWLKRLFDVKTNLLNLRDLFYVTIGFFQSLVLLKRVKPDVILLKGGFVGAPVGLAAAVWRIPFITHDSDALPGLANRLVSRWAAWHATGMPAENYGYPKDKTRFIGVLLSRDYQYVTHELMHDYRKDLKLPTDAQVLFITGGSLGAQPINLAMKAIAPRLLEAMPKLYIVHVVGQGHEKVYGTYHDARLAVYPLVKKLHRYSGAADVIVARAGATNLAEFGVQAKACILVPNPLLTGGHQLMNAQHLEDADAVVVVEESSLSVDSASALQDSLEQLFSSSTLRKDLGKKLHSVTPGDATQKLADLIIQTGHRAGE